jgi:hypothetical protein
VNGPLDNSQGSIAYKWHCVVTALEGSEGLPSRPRWQSRTRAGALAEVMVGHERESADRSGQARSRELPPTMTTRAAGDAQSPLPAGRGEG